MKFKSLFIIIFLTAFSFYSAYSAELFSEGFGKSSEESRASAASELSFIIYSEVNSSVRTDQSDDPENTKNIVSRQTDITSSLPIYGAVYKTEQIGNYFKTEAVLKSGDALPVYYRHLDDTVSEIEKLHTALMKEKSESAKYRYVMECLTAFDNMKKLKSVIYALGGKISAEPNITISQLIKIQDELSGTTDSLKHAAELIAKETGGSRVYVYYPMYRGSDEVTPFAEYFRDLLTAEIDSAGSIHSAEFYLETNYSEEDSGIYLTSVLTDKKGVAKATSVKKLLPESYRGLRVKPESVSFEKLLKTGLALSSDFRARIATENGKKAMLYKQGDSVELFVKLNRPGYFFIVGHVDKPGGRASYLVDFYQAQGGQKFIRRVDAEDINRWISIGEFDIVPPFGLETFQMIASVNHPADMLPSYVFDPETELYIVSRDLNEGVRKTRAIKTKQENNKTVAEDVLVFSTTEK